MSHLKFNYKCFFKTREELEKNSVAHHLKKNFLFEDMSEAEIAKLERICHTRNYRPGERIFFTGKEADAVFIVKSGTVSITISENTSEKELAVLKPGDFFGETGLLDDAQRTGNATSKEQSEIIAVMREDFLKFVSQNPVAGSRILLKLVNVLGTRLLKANNQIIDLSNTLSSRKD